MNNDDVMIELVIQLRRNGVVDLEIFKAGTEIAEPVASLLTLGMLQHVALQFRTKPVGPQQEKP